MFETNIVFGITVVEAILALHLLAVVFGAGSAFMADLLFNHHMKNRTINTDEYKDLRFASHVTWLGLGLMAITGFLIFLSDVDRYLDSSKFLAKMTIVLILAVNGGFIHVKSVPLIEKYRNKKLLGSKTFFDKSRSMFWAGAVSGTSWTAAIFLGAFRSVSASFWQIMIIYVAVLAVAVAISEFLHNFYLKKHN